MYLGLDPDASLAGWAIGDLDIDLAFRAYWSACERTLVLVIPD